MSETQPLAASQGTTPANSRPRLTKIVAIALIAVAGFGIWYFAIHDRGQKDDFTRIQGEWKIAIPGEEPSQSEGRPPSIIRIEGDHWTYVSGGRETSSWHVALDPNVQPKQIDLTRLEADGQPALFTYGARKGAEVKQLGVYSLDGETFKVTLAPVLEGRPQTHDGEVPTLTLTRMGK